MRPSTANSPSVLGGLMVLVRGTVLDWGEDTWRKHLLAYYLPADAPEADWLEAIKRVLAAQGTSIGHLAEEQLARRQREGAAEGGRRDGS